MKPRKNTITALVEKLQAEISRLRAQADQNDAELGLAQAEIARLRSELQYGTATGEPCAYVVRVREEVARMRDALHVFLDARKHG